MRTLLTIYLLLGFIYAMYITIKNPNKWPWFPINWLIGPITVVYLFFITAKGKKLPMDR